MMERPRERERQRGRVRESQRETEREYTAVLLSLLMRPSFHHGGFALMTPVKPNHLPKAPSSNTITLGVRASAVSFGRAQAFRP